MTASRFTNEYRVKASAFEEDVRGGVRNTAFLSPEYPGDTHGCFAVTDHQVVLVQFSLNPVQGDEFRAFGNAFHDNFVSFDFIFIERVQRLTESEQDVIGHVHDVVDWVEANGFHPVL